MSFIDQCPACQRRIYWRLPDKKGMPCPHCKTTLVETRNYRKMNTWGVYLLNLAHIILFIGFRLDHMRHESLSALLLWLYGAMLLSSGALFAYATLIAERYEPVEESVEKECA